MGEKHRKQRMNLRNDSWDFWPNLSRERWLKWTVLEINKGNRTDNREIRVCEGFSFFLNLLSIKARRSKRKH